MDNPDDSQALQYDIAEHVTKLLKCDYTLKVLRGVSREWKGLATQGVRHLRPRAGQRAGALDLAIIAERFPHVETLNLQSVSGVVRNECLASCTKMRQLRGIVLDGCKQVTNDGLAHLPTGIQSLSLRNCSQITWAGLRELSRLQHLTALNVAGIKLSSGPQLAAAAALQGAPLPQVHAGPIAAAAAATEPAAPVLWDLLQRLESLTLGDPMSLSFIADRMLVEEVASVRPSRLTHLDLSGCIDLTDWAVQELSLALPSLTSLSLQSCVRLTNGGALDLGRLTRLRALNLRGCLQLSDSGLGAGISALSSLEELNLQGCTSITGSCLSELSDCKFLAVLNMSHCAAFSSMEPLRCLPGLRRLDVSHCSKLNPAGITTLTALTGLTEVRASHLRHQPTPPPLAPDAASTATVLVPIAPQLQPQPQQLSSLASLEQLQALDLSYMSCQGGVPCGLMDAVAALTRLTRLTLAGCGAPCGALHRGGFSVRARDELSGLGFLSCLRRLEDLDLGGWQEVDPQELSCLVGATALRRLVVSRLGNRHANACFEGCDCSGSGGASSLYGSGFVSPTSSTTGSPPVANASLLGARAAESVTISAGTRCELAAWARACSSAMEAAAADAASSRAQSSATRDENGGEGSGRRVSCNGSTTSGDTEAAATFASSAASPSSNSSSSDSRRSTSGADGGELHGGPLELDVGLYDDAMSSSSQPLTARFTAAPGDGSLQTSVGGLTRQMAAVGIRCCLCSTGRISSEECSRCRTTSTATVVGAVAAVAVEASASQVTAATADGVFERVLAAVPAVSAPLPSLEEAARAAAATLLAPMPLTPRPGIDGALSHLTALTALAEIHLEACNHLTDAGVARLAHIPRLELLDLGGCNRVTGRTLGAFATHGSLHTLLLGNCASLTDAGLAATSSVSSLRIVDVSGCNRLSDAGAVTLGSLRRLSRLSLRSNSKCCDRTVEALSSLPALQWVCLSLCGITDTSLRLIGSSARSLTWLDLSHCWRLSRTAVRQLELDRPQLKVIFSGRN